MLTKKYEHIEQNEFGTLLSEDVSFQGVIESQDSILIKGTCSESTLKGTLLVVAQDGQVEGKVTIEYLVISGMVNGKVNVSENLHVLKNGEIKGSLSTTSLVVDEGALVNAHCTTISKKEDKDSSQKNSKKIEE